MLQDAGSSSPDESRKAKSTPATGVSKTKTKASKVEKPVANLQGGNDGTGHTKEKRKIIINICVLSVAFMVHFTAFQGAGNLQSAINHEVGTASLATIYLSLIFSNLFLPVVVIRRFGCKWAVAVSFFAYIPYMIAQFHPTYYTMIPAALMVGFGGGPLWCGKCTYLSLVAERYSEFTGESSQVLTVRFFGIFFMFFQFSQVFGNLISSTVFSSGPAHVVDYNVNVLAICGANFCPLAPKTLAAHNRNLERPSDGKIYIVAGIYVTCMVSAVLIVAFGVDSLKKYGEGEREGSGTGLTGIKLLGITMKLVKERYQQLIIPLTVFMGVGQAFMAADYTEAFVSCAWGIEYIGYVMICYGVFNAASAVGAGWLVKLTGRFPVVSAAAILHACLLITLIFWSPHPDHRGVFFVLAALWGVCDGVWLVQVNALCGILFPGREEAAYSNFRVWESLGFIISYSYSPYLCTDVKIYIILVMLCIGMVGYAMIEITELQKSRVEETERK